MSRINRRTWTMIEFGDRNTKGFFGLLDVAVKENLRITDDEYDFISGEMTEDEADFLLEEKPTFAQRRKIIETLNKYVEY
jgi:hypothetical protein